MSETFPQGQFARRAATVVLAVYWLTLVTATHWPLRFLPRDKPLLASDKLLHFSAYAGLAFLLSLVVYLRRPSSLGLSLGKVACVWVVVVVSGLCDEFTQPLVGRDFEWYDWLADSVGGAVWARPHALVIRLLVTKDFPVLGRQVLGEE